MPGPPPADVPCMDISAAGLSALKQEQIQDEVNIAVAKKAMDMSKEQGAMALSLLETAADVAKPLTPSGVGTRVSVLG